MSFGNPAQVGTQAKLNLRDYLKSAILARNGGYYTPWGGFDCVCETDPLLENGLIPDSRPLLVLCGALRSRKRAGSNIRLEITIELEVRADASSGAFPTDPDDPGAADQLADDAEAVLDTDAARTHFRALGMENLTVGTRRESLREQMHMKTTPVSFSVLIEQA